ncbi:hypothetical protein SALBM311S_01687 [Streptomyces alboniger]
MSRPRLASEAMCTIRPPPRSIMESSTARVTVMVPRRLMSMIRSQVSSALSTKRPITSMAALLTSTSTGPSSTVTCATASAYGRVGDVRADGRRAHPVLFREPGGDPSGRLRVHVADGDRGPLGGESVGDRLADAAAGSGDECHLVPYAPRALPRPDPDTALSYNYFS